MRHQFVDVELVLAGETTHSTDQPEDKAVKLANMSSTAIPENKATSKAEFTNTQQGGRHRICLSPLTRYARLFGWRGLFCRKSD